MAKLVAGTLEVVIGGILLARSWSSFREVLIAIGAAVFGVGVRADFLQDYVGVRALLWGGDTYPELGSAFAALGLDWPVTHRSTHPPTAFLFALPVAQLPWRQALVVWILAMLICLATAGLLYGLRWYAVLVLTPLAILWPPATWSLLQLTPLWLLGIAVAWHFRRVPLVAGAAIGLASLTKFLPALSLVPFVRQRQWGAVAGFALTWLLAGAAIFFVLGRSDVITTYLAVNRLESFGQMARADNGSFLVAAWRFGGLVALAPAVVLLLWIAYRALFVFANQTDIWACWVWLSVAILPIAWIYSSLPLLPWLCRLARHDTVVVSMLARLALLSPLLWLPTSPSGNPIAVASCIALSGLAIGIGHCYKGSYG